MGMFLLNKNEQKNSSKGFSLARLPLEEVTVFSLVILLLIALAVKFHFLNVKSSTVISILALTIVFNVIILTWKWHLRDESLTGIELIFTPSLITIVLFIGWYLAFVISLADVVSISVVMLVVLALYVGRIIHWERILGKVCREIWQWAICNKERAIGVIEITSGFFLLIISSLFSAQQISPSLFGFDINDFLQGPLFPVLFFGLIINGSLNAANFYAAMYQFSQEHPLAFRGLLSGLFLAFSVIAALYQQWVLSIVFFIAAFTIAYPVLLYSLPQIIKVLEKVTYEILSRWELSIAIVEGAFTLSLPFWAVTYLGERFPFIMAILILDVFVHSINGYEKSFHYFKENKIALRAMIFGLSLIAFLLGLYFQVLVIALLAVILAFISGYPFILLAIKKCLVFLERAWQAIKTRWYLLMRVTFSAIGILIFSVGIVTSDPWFILLGVSLVALVNLRTIIDLARKTYFLMLELFKELGTFVHEAWEMLKSFWKSLIHHVKEHFDIIARGFVTILGVLLIFVGLIESLSYLILVGIALMTVANLQFVRRKLYHLYLFIKSEGLTLLRYLSIFLGILLILIGLLISRYDLVVVGMFLVIAGYIKQVTDLLMTFLDRLLLKIKENPLDMLTLLIDGIGLIGYVVGSFLGNDLLLLASLMVIGIATSTWMFIRIILYVFDHLEFLREYWKDILRLLSFSLSVVSFLIGFVQHDNSFVMLGVIFLILTIIDRIVFILRNFRVFITNLFILISPWLKSAFFVLGSLLALATSIQVLVGSYLPKYLQVIPLPEFSLLVRVSIGITLGLVGAILIWQAYLVRPDEETRQQIQLSPLATKRNDSMENDPVAKKVSIKEWWPTKKKT